LLCNPEHFLHISHTMTPLLKHRQSCVKHWHLDELIAQLLTSTLPKSYNECAGSVFDENEFGSRVPADPLQGYFLGLRQPERRLIIDLFLICRAS
jgi:hypothetical protein